MRTVLLPVKDFRYAKQRLAPVLEAARRAGLARAMLFDVMEAISKAGRPERVVVFTDSDEAMEISRSFGFDIVPEVSVQGHSAAVNQMLERLSPAASRILSIAGDLPTISSKDIDDVLDSEAHEVGLVAPRDGTGTNGLLLVTPARIRMEYGQDSLKRHLTNAASAGFQAQVLHIPGIEFDIDTPEDLQWFREGSHVGTHTWKYIARP